MHSHMVATHAWRVPALLAMRPWQRTASGPGPADGPRLGDARSVFAPPGGPAAARAGAGAADDNWRAAFERRYELGAALARGAAAEGGRLPAAVDAAAAGGHLLAACLAHRALAAAPDAGTGAACSAHRPRVA